MTIAASWFKADCGQEEKLLDFYLNVIDLLTWPQDAAALVLPQVEGLIWEFRKSSDDGNFNGTTWMALKKVKIIPTG